MGRRGLAGRRRVKRAMDVVLGAGLLAGLGPVMVAVGAAVGLSAGRPILFVQERIGEGGRRFRLLKFRTMAGGDAPHVAYARRWIAGEPYGELDGAPVYKIHDDPRVTPLGRVLRWTKLDELPQLFNVLRGDMSLVGPRPALPYELDLYGPEHRRRLDGPPGMTGLWQVSGGARVGFEEMVRLDLAYLDGWTPWMDVAILARTVPAIVRQRNAG